MVSSVIRPFINGFMNPEHIFSEMLTFQSRVIIFFYAVVLCIITFFLDITLLLLCRSSPLQLYCIGSVHQYNSEILSVFPQCTIPSKARKRLHKVIGVMN